MCCTLTHLPLLPHIYVSEIGQHWFRQWLGAFSVPIHYMNQWWLVVNWTPGNKFRCNSNRNSIICIQKLHLKLSSAKMVAILSWGRGLVPHIYFWSPGHISHQATIWTNNELSWRWPSTIIFEWNAFGSEMVSMLCLFLFRGQHLGSEPLLYHMILRHFKYARYGFRIVPSLWCLTGVFANVLPMSLQNVIVIRSFGHWSSQLRGFLTWHLVVRRFTAY